MQIVEYAKAHPYATGAVVIIGGILFIMIVRGGSSSSSASGSSGPSDAQIAADAQLQAAQIQAQAGVQAASIGAGVQLNSDNKAAEVAMAQIQSQTDIYKEYFDTTAATQTAAVNAASSAQKTGIAAISSSSAKGRYKAAGIDAILTGQNTFQFSGNAQSSTPGTLWGIGQAAGGIGSMIGSIGSLFSDERLKENITWVGHDKNGRNLYSFNYRGSKTKRVGYIAQDIARAEPEKVTSGKGGYARVINLLPSRPAPVSLRSY